MSKNAKSEPVLLCRATVRPEDQGDQDAETGGYDQDQNLKKKIRTKMNGDDNKHGLMEMMRTIFLLWMIRRWRFSLTPGGEEGAGLGD